jgi:hypothetical protein
MYALLADGLVVLHLGFILFVFLGGLLVLRWTKAAWAHIPAFIWGVLIEWFGWICPLTPLENWLRARAGVGGYSEGFIDHYIVPIVYPPGLTRETQWWIGGAVLFLNALVYAAVWRRRRRRAIEQAHGGPSSMDEPPD